MKRSTPTRDRSGNSYARYRFHDLSPQEENQLVAFDEYFLGDAEQTF